MRKEQIAENIEDVEENEIDDREALHHPRSFFINSFDNVRNQIKLYQR